jgi:hypothetical protein
LGRWSVETAIPTLDGQSATSTSLHQIWIEANQLFLQVNKLVIASNLAP